MGPVYINLDAELQEAKLTEPLTPDRSPRASCRRPTRRLRPRLVKKAAAMLKGAKNIGHPVRPRLAQPRCLERARRARRRRSTPRSSPNSRSALRSRPTIRCMAAIPAGSAIPPDAQAAVKAADVILTLDWVDLAGVFKVTFGDEPPKAKVISISNDFRIHSGWSMDYQGLPPVDVLLPVTPDEAVPELNKALGFTAKPFTKRALPKRDKPDLSTGKLRRQRPRARAQVRLRRPRRDARAHLAVVGRRDLAVPASARLCRLGRRRRRRRRPGQCGRRRARAQGLRPAAGRGLRRRRLHDGQRPRSGPRRTTRSRS